MKQGLKHKRDHERKNSWQYNVVLEKCPHKKWQQMNWCLPSVLLSHRGMFCHLMMTAGAPLIAKEGEKGTVAVLHKKVAYKSLFLMDTQKPNFLCIVPLVSCAVNDANSDIILILNIKAAAGSLRIL